MWSLVDLLERSSSVSNEEFWSLIISVHQKKYEIKLRQWKTWIQWMLTISLLENTSDELWTLSAEVWATWIASACLLSLYRLSMAELLAGEEVEAFTNSPVGSWVPITSVVWWTWFNLSSRLVSNDQSSWSVLNDFVVSWNVWKHTDEPMDKDQ